MIRNEYLIYYASLHLGPILSVVMYLFFLRCFFTARRSYASAVLGVVILSARLSVCDTRAL